MLNLRTEGKGENATVTGRIYHQRKNCKRVKSIMYARFSLHFELYAISPILAANERYRLWREKNIT